MSEKKPVSITVQFILCLIPIIWIYGFFRIEKLISGILMVIGVVILAIVIQLFFSSFLGYALAWLVSFLVPIHYMIKWSREWNESISHSEKKSVKSKKIMLISGIVVAILFLLFLVGYSQISQNMETDKIPITNSQIPKEPVKFESKTELTKPKIASFVDPKKDPQSYIARYNNEPTYKQWFDENYPEYSSIYQAVGLDEPEPVKTEPVKTEPVKTEPVKTEPVKTEPTIVCSGFAKCFSGKVTKIVDGDTLDVDGIRIRISLTNTPERNELGFSDATDFTTSLCPVGSIAFVDQDDLQLYDVYKRMLGKVTCSGKVLNSELLYNGFANILSQYCSTSEFASEPWARQYGCSTQSQGMAPQISEQNPPTNNSDDNCDPSYPDFCIPPHPPDLDCKDVPHKKFTVYQPDPHRFDGDKDGIGCER